MIDKTLKNGKDENADIKRGEVIIYKEKSGTVRLDVRLEKETVWLTQKQISELFLTDRSVITKHLGNIFKSKELRENSVCAKIAHTAKDGKVYSTKFYNLDIIISVGYRVNSNRATQFRIWATRVLKNYLVKGYVLNQKKLIEHATNLRELQDTIAFISSKATYPQLIGKTDDLLKLLSEYSKALTILHEYDNNLLKINKRREPTYILTYGSSVEMINEIRGRLREKGEATELFGRESGHRFKGIIGALYQTFDRKELYASVEEKAAHILYLIIKDHPFSDGNKRVGSLLFVYFLDKNGYLRKPGGEAKFNDNTIVALSLLIAASDPREKETMIKIVTNLLK